LAPYQAFILGIVQGLTEFLPISSSGHLVISQQLLGLTESELYFDVSVHIGTLVAVVIFFRQDLGCIASSLVKYIAAVLNREPSLTHKGKDPHLKLALLIVIGTLPTAIVGLFLRQWSDQIFASVLIAGSMLVITGILLFITGFLLWGTRRVQKQAKDVDMFRKKDALAIGLVQGLAIIPGISRSGSTIAVGLFLGLERETAARFSFLLSIPAILGAGLLIFMDIPEGTHFPFASAFIGGLTSCVVGYVSLRFLVTIVKKGNLYVFAPYCWIAGLLSLFLGL
jgi:undecaprenyl-diphosphatase